MRPLPDAAKKSFQQLVFSPPWKAVEQLIDLMIQELNERQKVTDDQWETLRNFLDAEGQIHGLRRLQQEVIKHATNVKT